MRVLKFRGKKIDSNEWVYGSLVNNLWCYAKAHKWAGINVCEIITSGECSDYEEMQLEEFNITVDPKTVGQFPGLKDKNGKDIYEGDILNHPNSGNFEVKFEDYGFYLFYNGFKQIGHVTEYMEVIGNIHENPELLNT